MDEAYYSDGRFYDYIYGAICDNENSYLSECLKYGGPILEVGCGTGRITIPLARLGLDVTGLDISRSMLDHAMSKANSENLKIEWIHQDCRNFSVDRKFKVIFMPFNSIQHLHDLESMERFFVAVKKHLLPDGVFMFDIFNPDLSYLTPKPGEVFPVSNFFHPEMNQQIKIEESCKYDVAKQVTHVKWFYKNEAGEVFKTDNLSLRCFFPQEIDAFIKYNGFEVLAKYGTHSRDPFESESAKQFFVLREL